MTFLSGIWHDVRIAWRTVARQPVSSLMIVGILAVGVAGMTTVFSLFNGLFLRPLPVLNEQRMVTLCETDLTTGTQYISPVYARFDAWRQYNQTFECMGFCSFWESNLSLDDKAERVGLRLATHDFLKVLGVQPVLGRYFTAEEDRSVGPNVALVSFGLWERLFGKDPAVLGRTLRLDGDPFTIIGVLPPQADFPERRDIWQPLRAGPDGRHGGLGGFAMGLLKQGVTVEQAREDLARIHQGWAQQHPEKETTTLSAIMACAGLYGVISYSMSRRIQEIGIRVALGARIPDVTRMILKQGFRFIAVGLPFGVVGGFVLSRLFASVPGMLYHVSPNDPVTFLGVIVLLTGVALLACYLPARRAARIDPMVALRYE